MKYICFIVTSFWAYGELNIALEFAHRLPGAGYKPIFLIPPSHENILKNNNIKYYTLIPKSRKLNLIVLQEIQTNHNPAAVVLADFLNYTFCERHYGLTLDDLSIFPGKIGTFDIYDFETTQGRVDTYGFLAANMHSLSLKNYDFLLQPCPVNHFEKKNEKEFRYSLFDLVKERTEIERDEARKRLGTKKNEKILLITSAVWQQRYRLYDDIIPFINACNSMMETVLEALPDHIKVISIGARTLFVHREKSNFVHYDEMLPTEFQNITNACDLYISNNFISTSMVKMVLSGVPTLLIQNSIFKKNNSEKWFKYQNKKLPGILAACPVAYPFRMFPVGWYSFLKDIVKNNPFYMLMSHSELFTPGKMKEKILTQLTGENVFAENRKTYRDSLMKLPTIEKDFKL